LNESDLWSNNKILIVFFIEYTIFQKMSREDLLKYYMNKDYIEQHLNHYAEFISKEFHYETRFKKNPHLILDRFDVFILIMNMIQNKDFENLYRTVNPMTLEFRELSKQLGILEDQMFRG
jgi:hypothetical protein